MRRHLPAHELIDGDRVDRLRSLDAGLVGRLIEVFARTTPALLQQLREAPDDGARRKLAHKLRGGSDAVGAQRLSELAWRLEHGEGADVAELEPIYRQTLGALQRLTERV